MSDGFRRGRRVVATLASLAIAATISVAAPAAASAAPVRKGPSGPVVIVEHPAKGGSGGGATANDWVW